MSVDRAGWILALVLCTSRTARAEEGAAWEVVDRPAASVRLERDPAPRLEPLAEPVRSSLLRARVRFEESDYRGAALEYERALPELAAGQRRDDVLSNIALCYERAFAYEEAIAAYERYLREASVAETERAEVQQILHSLRDRLGDLRVASDVRAEVSVDDHLRGHTPLELTLTGGEHVIALRAPGRRDVRRKVRIVPRARASLHVDLPLELHYRGSRPAYFYAGAAFTVGSAVLGAALGGRALALSHDAQQRRERGIDTDGDARHIRRLTLAADLSFGATALFATSTLVLYFLTDFRARSERPSRTVLTPTLSPSGVGIVVRGRL